MNDFFYESRGKEKIKDLMEEGMRSQEFHRSGAPKLILTLLGILGLLGLLIR